MKIGENTQILINDEKISFCSQNPHIIGKSIKENILFYDQYNEL